MTREEAMDYRRSCPYDAMGDFSIFEQTVGESENEGTENKQIKRRKIKNAYLL